MLLQLLIAAPGHALSLSCHIHPPQQETESPLPRASYGPFATEAACLAVKQRLFGAAGRCHCAPGFSFGSRGRPGADITPEVPDAEALPLP